MASQLVDAGIKPLKRKKKANGMGAVKIADHPPQFKPTAQAVTYTRNFLAFPDWTGSAYHQNMVVMHDFRPYADPVQSGNVKKLRVAR
jgi:hypothetical protein